MLSAEQKRAVDIFDKNSLLLAPAGTGKTFTLAHKVAEAIKRGIKPEEILLLTFTVKARDEIKEDVFTYAGERAVNAYTVHGFCFDIIKNYSYNKRVAGGLTVADETDTGELIKSLADAMIAEKTELADKLTILPEKQLSRIVSLIKYERDKLGFSYSSKDGYGAAIASLINSGEYIDAFSFRKSGAQITDYNFYNLLKTRGNEFCLRYADLLSSSSLLDFDDILLHAKEIVFGGDYPTDGYKLVVLDEVQDTSLLEYSIVEKFFSSATVMLCGDENQTIYGWRGSDPKKIISAYKEKYSPEEIRLTINRRATETLKRAAEGYLAKVNCEELPAYNDEPDGEKIAVYGCESDVGEAKRIFSLIENFDGENTDVCVMTRSNRYLATLYKNLQRINANLPKERRIPFFTADADHQFDKRPIIKDFTSFMRLIVNPSDIAAMERITKRYVKSVKRDLVAAIGSYSLAGVSVGDFTREDSYLNGDGFYSLIKAYEENSLIVYDFETTGADPRSDDPVQISAIKFGKSGKKEEFNLFVIPEKEISSGALATHGYDLNYIKSHGGVSINEAIRRFADFLSGCVLVGHNSNAFDDILLKRLAVKEKIELIVRAYYDTLVIAKTFFKNEKNYKLSTLCEKFGVVNDRAHDAFSDVLATKDCLKIMLDGYIIPTAGVRQNVVRTNVADFKPLYENMKHFKAELEKGDVFSLIKDISATYSLITPETPKADREAANDLYAAIKDVGAAEYPVLALGEYLSDTALSGSKLDSVIKKLKKVPLITVHQSKGCEFSFVIFAGAGEDEIPSYPARTSGREDEEKRIFYVALTRAKKKLAITYKTLKPYGSVEYPSLPSPYISLIPSKYITEK